MVLTRVKTAFALGAGSIARVMSYRLLIKTGVHPAQRLSATAPAGRFFGPVATELSAGAAPGEVRYFGWIRRPLDDPPDWHRSVVDGKRGNDSGSWWTIPDFDPGVGDVKGIWEPSRFDWVVAFAQRASAGDAGAVTRLNAWLNDWSARNPPYRGHNWKCGQEASIRVIRLAVAAHVLGQAHAPSPALAELIALHLRRIAPTVGYARGQDNNHGTSEAAALFIGGSWLRSMNREGPEWERQGRELLEERSLRLIAVDGSFSQYSTNYHRLMLETLTFAEVWRRHVRAAEFSAGFHSRASAATEWLRALVDPASGGAPNIGANDGANLLPLTDADYRDFRPAVHLATAVFQDRAAYVGDGSWRAQLAWLRVPPPARQAPPARSGIFDDGGYAVLSLGDCRVVLRYPRFRFRPSHADALHVDLWVSGENLLRDAGTFSYAATTDEIACFAGVRGHSTVQFDDHDQMPKLSRFLWGDWLKARDASATGEASRAPAFEASYRDRWGAVHHRRIELREECLGVRDRVDGFAQRAVMRWRLRPGPWRIDGMTVTDGDHSLAVDADSPITRMELVTGWESRYYLQKTPLPVLEVEVTQAATVTSVYRWAR